MFSKQEAIDLMNKWGGNRTPFIFIIDFDMESVLLFQYPQNIPGDIFFSLPGISNRIAPGYNSLNYTFSKSPFPVAQYEIAFNKVIQQIYAGNTFLLNLTFPTPINTNLSLLQIFDSSYAKYKLLVNNSFVVFSPETFVKINNGIICSNPMKGTISAAIPNAKEIILADKKEMAEHYTIVDLIRNDLSLVATDVNVNRFRYTEKINTNFGAIIQVSSEIVGKLPDNYNEQLGTIMFTMLPAGSISGAPKPKTIEIIHETEIDNRGYYTGVFGFFDGYSLDSAVMIRFIENRENKLWFRSGGGITFQSNCSDEYNELVDKVYVPIY